MAKKSSSKRREERAENPVAEAEEKVKPSSAKKNRGEEIEKPSPAKKKRGDEIDEIFATKKQKKKIAEKEEKKKSSKELSAKPVKMKRQKKDDTESRFSLPEPSSKSRRKTGDGFTIYTEEELGLTNGDAGGTGQCPFDCSCCF